jgi:hypothetical protein
LRRPSGNKITNANNNRDDNLRIGLNEKNKKVTTRGVKVDLVKRERVGRREERRRRRAARRGEEKGGRGGGG